MAVSVQSFPPRTFLLDRLHAARAEHGFLAPSTVAAIALELRIPAAEAWAAATSYPVFRLEGSDAGDGPCLGLSCRLGGAPDAPNGTSCTFQCYVGPTTGQEMPFPEDALRVAGPVMEPVDGEFGALAKAREMSPTAALEMVENSGLRGRGGAYFPTGVKWRSALDQSRPVALVVNAEEGEPGVFKDRALLGVRAERFVEGLAIAQYVLSPDLTVIFINGEALPAQRTLVATLEAAGDALPQQPRIVGGGGGYILGEESALLNALEGRKPVPRLKPPLPVESGYFGMSTVINNVETVANLAVVFGGGVEGFRAAGTEDVPGTKILSVSGNVERPGVYEMPFGATLRSVAEESGGDDAVAALFGGPSGGFLPASEFGCKIGRRRAHSSGAFTGAGSVVFIAKEANIREAVLDIAQYNADEACGKCAPCREGSPRMAEALRRGELEDIELLMDVLGQASLCGLGQAAPGPVRSALHFWPELFR